MDKHSKRKRDECRRYEESEEDYPVGLNQQISPVTSATLRRWADLMVREHYEFFLSPVTVNPRGIMSYSVTLIRPDSDNPLPLGNYGWYLNRKDRSNSSPSIDLTPPVCSQSGPVRFPRAHGGEYGHEESENVTMTNCGRW
ncbi:hypothetical protein B0H14DRAFT_2641046 [Mycena olivaceomarginata]|nr:hypothetical protein B0H14DRAFT_2641046 [Mycena olivaceomarginata]